MYRKYHGNAVPVAAYGICSWATIAILSDSEGDDIHISFVDGRELFNARWCKMKSYRKTGAHYVTVNKMDYFISQFVKVKKDKNGFLRVADNEVCAG